MKKLFFSTILLLALGAAAHAQSCSTGFCPATITVHHKAGSVSPVTADITYPVVTMTLTNGTKCWITRSLGATLNPVSTTDATIAAQGWCWQFDNKQGVSITSSSSYSPSNPNWSNNYTSNTDWTSANDPCTLMLGASWSIASQSDWFYFAQQYTNSSVCLNSPLKLGGAYVVLGPGLPVSTPVAQWGYAGDMIYWAKTTSSATTGYIIHTNQGGTTTNASMTCDKKWGLPVRCVRTY